MLVLSYPKKHILFLLAVIIACCLLAPSAAEAQVPYAIINPAGGNTSTDGLRITITDTAILVKRNGRNEYNLSDTIPPKDRGLKIYAILEQKFGLNSGTEAVYLKACNISGVHGEGTAASPWKVATLATLTNPTGGIYNLTTVYSYVNGDDHYLVDFYVSAHERLLTAGVGGPYYLHIYFSERSWMNGLDSARGLEEDFVPCTTDPYYDDEVITPRDLPQLVGAECAPGDRSDDYEGGHYFKTKGGFTSHRVGTPPARDTRPEPGFQLQSQISNIVQRTGVAVHKAIEVDAITMGKTMNYSKRFIVGFDKAEIQGLDLPDPPLVLSENYGQTIRTDSARATIELSSAVSSGAEGNNTHPLEGLTLSVNGAMFNAPQIAYLRVVTTGTGTGHAIPGTDYQELYTHVIIPAESYLSGPVQLPLNNILINGDGTENPDKTLTVELLPTCSPYLKLGSVLSSTYTIVDDDENKLFLEAAQPALEEGQTMKVKVRMTGVPLPTPVTVSLEKISDSDAEDEDHSLVPATVTIPANQFEAEFDLTASPDRILEPSEVLYIKASAVLGTETKTAADTVNITDTTGNNAANKVIHFITQNATEDVPATFSASLPDGVSTELPVTVSLPASLSSGSMADASEFDGVFPSTITIGAFESAVDFTVKAKRDSRIEPDETAYFDATASGFTVQQASFSVADNQETKVITITLDQTEVNEGGTVTGTVTLPYPTTYALELDLLRDAASVADDNDITFPATKVTFAPLASSASFQVNVDTDLWLEANELLKIGGTYSDYTVVPGSVTIRDATRNELENCEFTIEPQGASVQEGSTLSVKVKLAPGVQSTSPVTITLSGADVDASDYILPASVTINPGDNEAAFTLTARTDLALEPAEALKITGNAVIAGFSSSAQATVNILDATANDADNKKISVNTPLSVTEGSSLSLTFSLPTGVTTAEAIDIDLAIVQTGAGYADNADFMSSVPAVLTIPAGGHQVTWSAIPGIDGLTEGTEHLVLQATNAAGFTVNNGTTVDVEVLDNLSASPATTIVFTIAPMNDSAPEGTGVLEITATLQSGFAPMAGINITPEILAGSTATGSDIWLDPVYMDPGNDAVTFYLYPDADFLLERTETLKLGGTAAGYTIVGTTAYIEDANSKQVTLKLDDPSGTAEVQENATLALRVELEATASESITVNLGRGAGTAASLLAGEYVLPATVTIPAGADHVSFNVQANPDGVIEPGENLEITATADVFGETKTSSVDVSVLDVTGTVSANKVITVNGAAAVTENNTVTYTFSLPAGITSQDDIVINLTRGTPASPVSEADFDPAIPSSITIPAGAGHADLVIAAAADGIIESTEKLQITPAASGYTLTGNVALDVADGDMSGAAIVITASANVQEGDDPTITATLQGGLTATTDIVVTLAKGTGSTAAASDHAALTDITIAAGSTSGSITLAISEDDLLESPETVMIEGSASGFAITDATVTIDDQNGADAANKAITVTPEALSIAEGAQTKVWVRLPASQRTQEALTVNLQKGSGSTTSLSSSEYSFPASVTIPAGGNEISFDLDAVADNVIEPTETLEIKAGANVYGTPVTAFATVDITDTNTRSITVSGAANVTEGSSAALTFSLPSGVTTAQPVTIHLAPGTATTAAASDITGGIPVQVTIPAGGNSGSLTVTATADGILESTEQLHLLPTATGFTFNDDVTLDIIDNDHTGATIALSASSSSIQEGAATTITATLQGGLTASAPITLTLTRGAASTSASSDHSALGTITINAGSSSGSTTITAAPDDIIESNETLVLEATGFTTTGITITITDNSGPKQITLSPEATTVTEGHTIKVWVRLPAGVTSSQAIVVTLDEGSGTVAGTTEYSFPSTVAIPANSNGVSFDLEAETDGVIEPNELLEIDATANISGTTATANTSVNIIDATGNKSISISGAANVTEGGNATLTFSLPSGITTAQAITISLAAGTATTAAASDITGGIPVQVTIPAGGNSGSLTVTATADGILESTEQLHLLPTATGFTFNDDVTLDIIDNDHTGATIALSVSSSTIQEGAATTITATLQGGLTASAPITLTLTRGAASTSASSDHSALGTITINAGSSSGSTTITAAPDDIIESNETLVLEATGFTTTGITITITDNSGPKQITLSPEATTVTEGHTIKVWVRLPVGVTSSQAIVVTLDEGSGTVAGTTEYSFPSTVAIPANSNGVSFDLEAETDGVIEPNELLEIDATANISGTTATANTSVNIIDATGNKSISISGAANVTEGSSATLTFSLPSGITTAQAITISLAAGTATTASTSDITGGFPTQVIIGAGQNSATLTIAANTDGVIEPAEKIHLLPSATGFTFNSDLLIDIFDEHHSGTITISSSLPAIREDDAVATITVSLPGALVAGSDITVHLQRNTASAAALADHSAIPSTVVIPGGDHAVSFTISAPADDILEATENLIIDGTAAAYSVNACTLQIEDATSLDPANRVITLSPSATNIAEDATEQFSVRLPAGIVSATPVLVSMSKTAGPSTAADTDHTQVPEDITIPAMSNSSADFNISAVSDGIIEPQETLEINGAVPAGFTFAGAVIHIDDVTGLDPANRQITIIADSTILHEGSTSKVIFALPDGITTAAAITLNVAAGADYTIPATVTIAAGDGNAEALLEAVQDNTDEPTETISLTATTAGFTVAPAPAVTIPGDEAPAISISASNTTDAAEPSTQGAFVLRLDGAATAPADITIQYTIAGTAAAGTDYAALSGQAVIKSGNNSVTVPVIPQPDQLAEGTETIMLSLQSASYQFLGNPVACMVNSNAANMDLHDNPGYDRSVRIEKISDAAEPATHGSVKVRFTGNITATVPVTVSYTVAGSATAGSDYTALPGTVTIPAGEQEAVIAIVAQDDQAQESSETIIISLTGVTNTGWSLAAERDVTVMLADDNDEAQEAEEVTMEVFAADEVTEGSVLPVTLRASASSPSDIPVTVTLQHDAARTVNPSVPGNGTSLTVTLPANQTEISFQIALEDNDTNDDDGFVNLVIEPHAGGGQPYGKGASGNTATRITDNDPLEIMFSKDSVKVMEGPSGTASMPFTLVLSRRSSRAITLHYAFSDAFEGAGADKDPQRANAGEDYHGGVTSIVIPPLQEEAEIAVPIFGDAGGEEDEYFALKLKSVAVPSGQNLPITGARSTAIGGIMNDDMPVDMEIRVHKALSPNGDGRNDALIIENIEKYPRNEIVILNRWGGTVFKTSNYNNQSNNFDGDSNAGGGSGNDLPDGSYFYILHVWESNGKMQRHTGYIVLKHAH